MSPTRQILDSGESRLGHLLDDMYKHAGTLLEQSVQSLREYDTRIARQVVDQGKQFSSLQHTMEQQCVQTIALQQPVASDLRRLMTDMFIAMELKHVVDHAAAIAGVVLRFDEKPAERLVKLILDIAEDCTSMLTLSRQAYEEEDEQLARSVAVMDDEVDTSESEFNRIVFEEMRSDPQASISCTYLLWITHNLERIGDRTSNIAERVVYMVTNETPELN